MSVQIAAAESVVPCAAWLRHRSGCVDDHDAGRRDRPADLIDRQFMATGRLADAGTEPSVGSRGDPNKNALAESVIGLFKTELIRRLDDLRAELDRLQEEVRRFRRRTGGPIQRTTVVWACVNQCETC
jgi:hypothetical protein